jgi:hypothetical protein
MPIGTTSADMRATGVEHFQRQMLDSSGSRRRYPQRERHRPDWFIPGSSGMSFNREGRM